MQTPSAHFFEDRKIKQCLQRDLATVERTLTWQHLKERMLTILHSRNRRLKKPNPDIAHVEERD
jgi:hypothetical protein